MSVRVRYAPSPTGLQHIGGVRTALFNYFFARSQQGTFILRVEDTDQSRSTDEALQDLYDTLHWLNIRWDEGPLVGGPCGPYIQSQRFEIYQKYAAELVESGKAYPCYCSEERLANLREEQAAAKSKEQGYDRHCRNLSAQQRAEFEHQGIKPVIRLKVPLEGSTTFHDVLMGDITRKNRDVNPDPVLLKSDGFPTYHLANVIDDHLMGITHIMRAQEWIPSGPLHVLLYEAFGWDVPQYCHLPMVMGKDGQKLSKRHGSTAVREFKEKGYLPEALTNYVSMVGWSYDGVKEFFTKEELEQVFTLEKINKAPGVFDYKKLDWYNGMYIRAKSDAELASLLTPYLAKAGFITESCSERQQERIDAMVPIVKERLKVLSDVVEMTRFLFEDIACPPIDQMLPKNQTVETTVQVLNAAIPVIKELGKASDEELEQRLASIATERNLKINGVFMPIRVAVTGSTVSPPLFDSIRLLGLETTMIRLERAITTLTRHMGK